MNEVPYQSTLSHAQGFADLLAYQVALQMQQEVFELTRTFPREEMFSLTDQIRRSSRSIGAQIAESWAKRRYEAHFISKLTDADSECLETLHWIETARRCGYLADDKAAYFSGQYDRLGRLIAGMIAKASAFCGKPSPRQIRETSAEYFVQRITNDE